jgi:predicted ATPase
LRLRRVEFRNFRSFGNFDLELAGESLVVIGENGGGKSSLLTGIGRALGRDLAFTRADFADVLRPIELRVQVEGLTTAQQGLYGNYVTFGPMGPALTMETRVLWNAAAEEPEVEHGYANHPGSRSTREAREAIPLLWLSASRDPARMLNLGISSNLMGTLLELLPLQAGLDAATSDIRTAGGNLAADPVLNAFLEEARSELGGLLPDVQPGAFSLGLSAITPRDLLRQLELLVTRLGDSVAVARQSSGIAQMAVFAFTLKLARLDPGTFLLVDEPEVSLHPQSQRALMRALRALDSQLIVATHSSNLLHRVDPRTVIRLRRDGAVVVVARPGTLSPEDAARLARFTTPQAADAFFARRVILVEGLSDQLAIQALADRRGRNLDAEGVAVVPIEGIRSIEAYLRLYGPPGFQLDLAGVCDVGEEQVVFDALLAVGIARAPTRAEAERVGFHTCDLDLEDVLVRALGAADAMAVIAGRGDAGAFRTFQTQPAYQALAIEDQIRRFIQRGSRKVEYAPLLVDALDLAAAPRALVGALDHV